MSPVDQFAQALWWHQNERQTARALLALDVDDQASALMVVYKRKGKAAAYAVAETLGVLR
jgi:hypothetical protein